LVVQNEEDPGDTGSSFLCHTTNRRKYAMLSASSSRLSPTWYSGWTEIGIQPLGAQVMKATIDRDGRIALGKEVQSHLGVQPGDQVLLENRGDEWVTKAAKPKSGLCYEGNVLVHHGVSATPSDKALANDRDERFEQLSEGLPK
jgi:bifunctional DNA-binding transcriptional regulator/antitoxin component of YhaV-PrlF toxin-antitoxin module